VGLVSSSWRTLSQALGLLRKVEVSVKNKEFCYIVTIALLFATTFILFGILIGSTNHRDLFSNLKWTDILSSFSAAIAGLATVFAASFAGLALKSWKQQVHVQRQVKFLDEMSEALNEYTNLIVAPIELVRYAKIGIEGYSLAHVDSSDFSHSGMVKYIEKAGQTDADTINDYLSKCICSLTKIRSLKIKGNLMGFDDYERCYSSCDRISRTYPAIQAFSTMMGQKYLNWQNPTVEKQVRKVFAMDPDDLVKIVENCNNEFLQFANEKYKAALK